MPTCSTASRTYSRHPRTYLRPPLRTGLPPRPSARRRRLEAVAICRLKRVAADQRGDIDGLLPPIPVNKNGKRVVCIGAGPASLAVANDLMPHGYEVTIFEKLGEPAV